MGIDKSELKKGILQDMGIKADDRLDALTAELYRTEGAAKALETAASSIERDVFARLRRDLDEGKVDPGAAQHADRYIHTCINFLSHLTKQSNVQVPIMQGRVDEATETVSRLKKEHDEEEAKIEAVRLAQASGEVAKDEDGELAAVPSGEKGPSRRPAGVRPSGNLRAQRAAEAAAEGAQDGVSESVAVETPPEPPAPARARPKVVPKTAPKSPPVPKAPPVVSPKPKPRVAGETPEDKKAARQAAAKKKRAAATKKKVRGKARR